MSELDVVRIPGYDMWARRAVVEAWTRAGRPRLNWAGRTVEQQRYLYDLWRQGKGNAADNPDANTRQPHVRGMALDLAVWNASTVNAMAREGFIRPITKRRGTPWPDGLGGFSQDEGWHFELRRYVGDIFSIPKVTAGQVAGLDSKPFEEDDMTPEQATQLDAIYKALFGPNNGPKAVASPLAWRNIGGDAQNVRYGVLPITIHTQELVGKQAGRLAAVEEVVEQLASANGATLDMAAIEQAAERGAREALDGLTLRAVTGE